MSIYKTSSRFLKDCKIKTFNEYAKDFSRDYVVITDEIDSIDANELIKLIKQYQKEYNTTDLIVRTVVTDGYYETAMLVIERRETDLEFNERIKSLYDYQLAVHANAIKNEERERELESLKKQQADIQTQIDAL